MRFSLALGVCVALLAGCSRSVQTANEVKEGEATKDGGGSSTLFGVPVRVLLHERFSNAALPGWQLSLGAAVGEGADSIVRVAGGALELSADAGTRRFISPAVALPLHGDDFVRISVDVATRDVSPAGARFQNCDLYARFGDGPVVAVTPVYTGSVAPRREVRLLRVPQGATVLKIGMLLSMPGAARFSDLLVESMPSPFIEQNVGHFRYRHFQHDAIPARALSLNEESWARAIDFFGAAPAGPVTYWKYPDRTTLREFTGLTANALNLDGEIHSIWATEPHELAHLFATAWGSPPSLLAEGVAVFFSEQWQGEPIFKAACAVEHAGRWVPLGSMLDTQAFRQTSEEVAYPEAGALVAWLNERLHRDGLRTLYGRLSDSAAASHNAKALEDAVHLELRALDERLRAESCTANDAGDQR